MFSSVTAAQSEEESQLTAKAIAEADLLSSGKKDLVDILLEKLKLTEESGVLYGQQSSNATTGDPDVPLQDGTVPPMKVTQENSQSETFQKPKNSTPSGKPVKKRKYKFKEGLAHYSSIKKVTKPVSESDDSFSAPSESDEDNLPLQKEPRKGMVRRVVHNRCGFVPTHRSQKTTVPVRDEFPQPDLESYLFPLREKPLTQTELLENYKHVGKKDFDKSQTDKARAEKEVCKIAGVPSNEEDLEKMVEQCDYAWSMKHEAWKNENEIF